MTQEEVKQQLLSSISAFGQLTDADKKEFIEFLSKVLLDVKPDTNSPFNALGDKFKFAYGGGNAAKWCVIIGACLLVTGASVGTGGIAFIVLIVIGIILLVGGTSGELLESSNNKNGYGGRKSRRTRVNKRYLVKCLKKSKRRKQSCGKKRRY
jgi:hypothetical protein